VLAGRLLVPAVATAALLTPVVVVLEDTQVMAALVALVAGLVQEGAVAAVHILRPVMRHSVVVSIFTLVVLGVVVA
jgi:hypothetical protein